MQNCNNQQYKVEFKKRLYNFILNLIKFIDLLNKRDRTVFVISDQLLRSGTSILGNYVEAQAASSKRDFTNFFNHSLKSANESKLWLALLRDTSKADKEQVNVLLKELTEVANIFGSSILTLKGKK